MNSFSARIISWQQKHGRHDLPWQTDASPYRVWLSEVMLQQTQVSTVIPYFERFITRFPTLATLARANEQDVLGLWSGLGYYSRARNLHRTARILVQDFQGSFPDDITVLTGLPGIGLSTAGAIAALAFGHRAAILDGNVKRVLARHAGIAGWPGLPAINQLLWSCAQDRLPRKHIKPYTQGMMDLGATVCTRSRPHCDRCPVRQDCAALQQGMTDQWPSPRPKRPIAEKHLQVLLCLFKNELLLEKRPARGIWGGLLSLPELPSGVAAEAHVQSCWNSAPRQVTRLPIVQHRLTHMQLNLSPVRLDFARRPGVDGFWLPLAETPTAALPAPIKTLIQQHIVHGGDRR